MNDTIAAIATPLAPSAIGILRLSGPEAIAVVDRVFTPGHGAPMSQRPDRALVYGALRDPEGQVIDYCLATVSRAPHSYTGEDTAELQCHGSPSALVLALDALFAAGARQALAGEFTRRAFLAGKLDLTRTEAIADLIHAESPAAVRQAAGQLGGALAVAIEEIYQSLTDLLAHFHAVLDYPDEDIEPFQAAEISRALQAAAGKLDQLAGSYRRGRALIEGVPCAIIGRPNAGKSTLFNALLGYDRAIVTPIAGTTRDVVEQAVQLGDIRLNLFDTAGLRQTDDPVEAEGVRRSWAKLAEAGLVLAVFDGSRPLTREDFDLARRCAGCRAIALVNKEDLPLQFDVEAIAPYFGMVIPVCCKEEGARKVIAAAVARLLGTGRIDPHAASLSGQRQLSAALRARDGVAGALEALDTGFGLDAVSVCVDDALAALYDLTGENASDAVIDEVFEKFCVGK